MQAQYVLAFDTANEIIACGIGHLVRETRTVEVIASSETSAHRASNTLLLTQINELCREAGIDRGDIACVAVGRGPGSFTGVRIAMATAKGIASALEVALIGISTLDAVAWGAQDAGVRGKVLVAADAMRKEVYPVRYVLDDEGITRLMPDSVVKAAEFASDEATDAADLLVAGDALVKYADVFASCGTLLDEDLWTPTGKGLLLALQEAWRAGEVDPFDAHRHAPAYVLPVYTRLSDAEEDERARNAREDRKAERDSRHITMNDTAVLNARADARGIAYKPLDRAHASSVAALENRIMGCDAWSEALVADELGRADRTWWAAYAADPALPLPDDAPLIGYAGVWVVDAMAQILKVGIDPHRRRQGIARALLLRVLSDARNLGATTCSLEVRASNEDARAFYSALGFNAEGTRSHYYSDGEDAVIMAAPIAQLLQEQQMRVAGMDVLQADDVVTCESAKDEATARTTCDVGAANDAASEGTHDAPVSASDTTDATDNVPGTTGNVPDAAQNSLAKPLILAIESSCDETAAAIVNGNGVLLADVLASQVDFHARFGGVVPEIASRKHIEAICGVCDSCLESAARQAHVNRIRWRDLDAVAATYTPGLIGALVVGVAFAKGVAWALDIPFIGVNHLEGHLYAGKIGDASFAPPAVVSLVSGGNTMLVYMRDWGDYVTLGATIDDAVGEAFDKVAKALGLGYPGGPVIAHYAQAGDPAAITFPRAMIHSGDLCFSLSGLKTAVVTYINNERAAGRDLRLADIAASFQQAVIDVQISKARRALEQTGAPTFCLGGGVAANEALRKAYEALCADLGVHLVMPPLFSCGDNAGMIALVALDRYKQGKFFDLNADACAQTDLDEPY